MTNYSTLQSIKDRWLSNTLMIKAKVLKFFLKIYIIHKNETFLSFHLHFKLLQAGDGTEFTIVDTPGFGDSDNDDNDLINEMVEALKDIIKTANGFVLLFNGQSERFDAKAQQMIREMEALFGNGFWDHVVLGVSFWHFDYNDF